MITSEQLVEARITGVNFGAPGSVEMALLAADGSSRWKLVANGVDDLCFEGLRLNSLIDEIFIFEPEDVETPEFLNALHRLLRGEDFREDAELWPFFLERIDLIRRGELKFWVIHPVYGGVISILAKEVRVQST